MKNTLIILGATLLLFSFLLVRHHLDTPNEVQQLRLQLLSVNSGVAARIRPVGQIRVAAQKKPQTEPAQATVAATTTTSADIDGQKVYQSGCVACHGAGIAGAPKVGNVGLWAARIAKGADTLYANAIKGMTGSAGVMPAKGGNSALSDDAVKAAVDYMLTNSK